MLIVITNEEISKFPKGVYDETDMENPVLISEAPFKFNLLAQNMQDFLCCGTVSGDEVQFKASGIIHEEVIDIPSGYEQRVLPPQYGIYLTQSQITTGLMLENNELVTTKNRVLTVENVQAEVIRILSEVVV